MIKIRENVRRVQRMVIDAQVKLMERLSSPVRQSFHLILETFPKTFIHRCGKRAKLSQ